MRILIGKSFGEYEKSFSEAKSLTEALSEFTHAFSKIAVVGSGGKTSLIMRLAEEQKALGKKVLVTTTTHMFIPERYGVLSGEAGDVAKALERDKIAVVGEETDGGKIKWPGDALYAKIESLADVIIIEADGSKRLPVKFPGVNEPAVPDDAKLIIAVSGLSALAKPGRELCHRWELARTALGVDDEERLEPAHLGRLIEKGYLSSLGKKFPQIPIIPVFNQADDDMTIEAGKKIADDLSSETVIISSFLEG